MTNIKQTIFLTGATGFLGSFILNKLLEKGYTTIILCRSLKEKSAKQRISAILKWFNKDIKDYPNLRIFEGNLDEKGFGIDQGDYNFILKNTDEFIHCASNTDFAEKNRDKIENTNIRSLNNVFIFEESTKIKHFHYISTAYACGNVQKTCYEKLYETTDFTNVYEETKNKAEHLVAEYCLQANIPYTIYRPSIVYGNSITGRSRKFNALYFPVKSIAYLKKIMLRDIQTRSGERAAQMGVRLKSDKKILMPLRMKYIEGSRIDVIPIEYFTNVMINIFEKKINQGIFNITNSSPTNLKILTDYTSRYLSIDGLETVEGEITDKTALEKLLDSYINLYLPYIEDVRVFDNSNTNKVIQGEIKCPELSYEVFKKCMDYAISVEWGKELV